MKTNCPNCGAPIQGIQCQYCGTRFFDLSNIDLEKENYFQINYRGQTLLVKGIPTECTVTQEMDYLTAELNGQGIYKIPGIANWTLDLRIIGREVQYNV